MDHSALLRGSEDRIMYLYMFSLITFDTFLTTCPKLNSQATDCSVCTHDHHCTYSESLFSSHGESFIADSDEDTLCFVACHSNDVFFGFFGNMVLCKVLQQYVSFNAVILFFFPHCDELHIHATKKFAECQVDSDLFVSCFKPR